MTYKETMEEALNRGHNAAKSIGDAGNEAAKNLYKKAQDAADHIEESVNKVAENLNEAAKRAVGQITHDAGGGEDHGNLIFGVFLAVSSTLFVYGICKAVDYFNKPKNEETLW